MPTTTTPLTLICGAQLVSITADLELYLATSQSSITSVLYLQLGGLHVCEARSGLRTSAVSLHGERRCVVGEQFIKTMNSCATSSQT